MQMKSAKELKGEETISQGNELTDCKDGTSPDLQTLERLYPSKTESGTGETGEAFWVATAMATNSAHLPAVWLCPSDFRILGSLLTSFVYFCYLYRFAQGLLDSY